MSSSMSREKKQPAHRKASKPLMERRRRARINACLAQLSALLTQARATQVTTCRRSRMEKADILELTVRHLKSLTSKNTDATLWSRFYSGYTDCAREVCRFLRISGEHPWEAAFLHPPRERPSAVNTGTVANLSFDHQFHSKWPLPALCMFGKPCTPGVAEGPLRAPAAKHDLLPSVETTARDAAVPSMMKIEYKHEAGGTEVWRPW